MQLLILLGLHVGVGDAAMNELRARCDAAALGHFLWREQL
jgi:hypothetical protein